jgi:VWFA-related protein
MMSQQAPQQPPRFTAGVDLMRLELTVLDKRTRKPITGLTADDFIVKVAGKEQVIEAFEEVRVTGRPAPLPRAFTEAATDVASNTLEQPRLFLIVMDDVFGDRDPRGNDGYTRVKAIDIANTVVDQLGPSDMAAVVFSQANTPAQDFTADRVALRRAIKTFTPRPVHPMMVSILSLGVLERANNFLRQMPGYRRAIVWVTLGPGSVDLDQEDLMIWTGEPGQPVSLAANQINETAASGAARVGGGGSMAPVPVYAYSLDGLKPVTVRETQGTAMPNPFGNEAMQKVTVNTGGRLIHGTNAPDRVVPAMFEELSSYYTLAYRGDFPMDGKLRWLDVQVKGHDVLIAPSGTSFTTPRIVDGRLVVPSKTERPGGLLGALAGPLPRGDIRITLAAVPLAVNGRREQLLALTLGLPTPAAGAAPIQYGLNVVVYDGEGRREILTQQLTMATTPRRTDDDALSEVAIPLALRPGRYAVRVAAQPVGSESTGSVFTTVVVPDFAREPLSLSGLAVGRAEGRPVGGRDALSDVLPFAPTTVRTFTTTDRVGALLRIHQGGRTPVDVTITSEILDVADAVAMTATRTIPSAQFQPGVGVDHKYELPLRQLAAGEYLLRVTVVAGKQTAHRDVRFTVR